MAKLMRTFGAVVVVGALVACGAVTTGGQTVPAPSTPQQKATAAPANPDAAVLADFNARLTKFVKFQRVLLKEAPLKETVSTAEITARQDLLASKIRNMRPHARQGDIFTPQVAALFRRLMYPELAGAEGRETKADIKEDTPTAVTLKVNAAYPSGEPLSSVPPQVLASLPQLPRDVEYRIVGTHLILRDVDANIIVDYMPNAIR